MDIESDRFEKLAFLRNFSFFFFFSFLDIPRFYANTIRNQRDLSFRGNKNFSLYVSREISFGRSSSRNDLKKNLRGDKNVGRAKQISISLLLHRTNAKLAITRMCNY